MENRPRADKKALHAPSIIDPNGARTTQPTQPLLPFDRVAKVLCDMLESHSYSAQLLPAR